MPAHGVQIDSRNYLMPADVKMQAAAASPRAWSTAGHSGAMKHRNRNLEIPEPAPD